MERGSGVRLAATAQRTIVATETPHATTDLVSTYLHMIYTVNGIPSHASVVLAAFASANAPSRISQFPFQLRALNMS